MNNTFIFGIKRYSQEHNNHGVNTKTHVHRRLKKIQIIHL
jgi:hypothetical protein